MNPQAEEGVWQSGGKTYYSEPPDDRSSYALFCTAAYRLFGEKEAGDVNRLIDVAAL